nr:MAG TPA: hypothetical protein [Caudoviricetes sp.]
MGGNSTHYFFTFLPTNKLNQNRKGNSNARA